MPTLEKNKIEWDSKYNWPNRGEEWSAPWGGSDAQWNRSILPRIKSNVPTNTILEIACGYGRWTQYLKDLCKNLIVVDLSARCIQACKQRFSDCSHIEYHVNDGKSLDMISESSVDFVFSFDSLVHADEPVIKTYIGQLHRILNDDGVAFIHHSNLGEYQTRYNRIRYIPKLEALFNRLGIVEKTYWRDSGVDAKKVRTFAEEQRLRCTRQEVIPWGNGRMFIDCLSTIVKNDSLPTGISQVFKNAKFKEE